MILSNEKRINTFRAGEQSASHVAVLADGSYVVVWQSNGQDGSGWGIYAQRFTATGAALGAELRVSSTAANTQEAARVLATSDGGFVIGWQDNNGIDGSGWTVLTQRYNAAGVAQGSNTVVNTITNSTQAVFDGAGYTGGYSTVYTGYSPDGTYNIYLQRWNNDGSRNGAEVLAGTATGAGATAAQSGQQTQPRVAGNASGAQVIVWRDESGNDGSGYGVYGRRFDASTGTFGDTFLVNTAIAGHQYEPSVSVAADGSFVVAWRSDGSDGSGSGVYAQRFAADNTKLGGEFLVNSGVTGGNQFQPSVLMLSTGGFVVAWYSDGSAEGSNQDLWVRSYNADGSAAELPTRITTSLSRVESEPQLADLGGGRWTVTYSAYVDATLGYDVMQQIFGSSPAPALQQAAPTLGDWESSALGGSVTFNENLVNAGPQIIDAAVSLTDLDSSNFDGGRLELYYVQGGSAEDQLGVRSVGTGDDQISVAGSTVLFEGTAFGTLSGGSNGSGLVVTFNANATVDAVEHLIQHLTYANTNASPATSRTIGLRVSDGDGGSSPGYAKEILVTREADGQPALYGEQAVDSVRAADQRHPDVAVLADGSYVVVWQGYNQHEANWDIYSQRMSASGEPIGPEITRINTARGSTQEMPRVTGLSDGNYVVIWDDVGASADGSGDGVIGQIYTASGTPVGSNFTANTFTSGTQRYSDAVSWAGGGSVAAGFGVVWASSGNAGGSSYDIYLQRFDNAGNKIGGELRVSDGVGGSAAQTGAQYLPEIASRANGDLVMVWRDDGNNDGAGSYGIFGRTYNAATGSFGATFQVNTTTAGTQNEPAVAMFADGSFVVVWQDESTNDGSSYGVYGQRFDAAGNKVGAEFLVNERTIGGQYQAQVTALSTGGFVVTWYNDNYDVSGGGTTSDVYVREYDAAGVAVDSERKLLSPTNSTEFEPAVADLGQGNFVVVYADYDTGVTGGTNSYGIAQQIFGSAAELPRQARPTIGDFASTVTIAENAANAGLQTLDASLSFNDVDSTDFAGGRIDLYYVSGGETTDRLGVRNDGTGAGQIGVAGSTISYGGVAIGTLSGGSNGTNLRIDLLPAATQDAVQALLQNLGYASSSSSPAASRTVGLRVADGDGGTSEVSLLTINVTPALDGAPLVHGEERVNTYSGSTQEDPHIGALADGGYVIAWASSGQDGSGDGVYMQRYNSVGVAVGGEVRVNTQVSGHQNYPQVAGLTGAGGGGWVVTWQDDTSDGSSWSQWAQRYDANGDAAGSAFRVATATTNQQYHGQVASYGGGFAVVWSSQSNAGGNGFDIYLKRYDNSGAVITSDLRVSDLVAGVAAPGTQDVPDVAAWANGNLAIVWRDNTNDGSGWGVYGRLYDAAAGTFGATFLINTTTAGTQLNPDVAVLSDGSFVVVWEDQSGNDGSSYAVYGQRYSAAGAKLGDEFIVNQRRDGGQYDAHVVALQSGGFVVAYYNDNYDISGSGSTADVYIREYTNAGVPIDGERKLVSQTNSTEQYPAIAALTSGNFVVAYSDYNVTPVLGNGGNTYEIAQQLFGSAASLARQANPVIGDVAASVTFAENDVNAAPQLIDAAVSVVDVDSADFAGGRLDLFYVQGGQATDQLGVRHVGNGAGQIGVAGGTVSFGGTAIGSIAAAATGANGAALRVELNANATAEAVEALIQSLTYASTSSSPDAIRTVGVRLSDGDGGSSTASAVTINVTPSLDGAPAVGGESAVVNTYRENHQEAPSVATLVDGSYVVVWQSAGQDGSGDGVYGQRFSASGAALGTEFRISTNSSNDQEFPHVEALSNGGFVVTWQDNVTPSADGSSWAQVGQFYGSNGAAVGANVVLNTSTTNGQYHGQLAGYTGGFAIAYASESGPAGANGTDIYLRRFDNAGAQTAAEVRINVVSGTAQAGTQYLPDVAAQANGDLFIVWEDRQGLDGSGVGIFGRTLSAGGVLGSTFVVNTTSGGNQSTPSVAALAGGGWVVVWEDQAGNDGNSYGVYAQLIDAAGNKLGGEFIVNERLTGGQYEAQVTGLSTGGFVVTWYNDNYDITGAGTTSDVYIREFSSTGVPMDGERKLASDTNSTERTPAVADLGNGNYVIAYADYNTVNESGQSTYEIRTQRFGDAAGLAPTSASPVLGDVRAQRLFSNAPADSANYAGVARAIDFDVLVSDADSANFDGGQLFVNFLSNGSANDALGIQNQGNGAGQVGVSGSSISVGGTVVGSFTGGGAGIGALTITFNANADAAAVQAVAQAITYLHTAPPAGTTNRYVGLRLTDGDGGASNASQVAITIQNSVSTSALVLDDVASSVTFTEAQVAAGAVIDGAQQLVHSAAGGFLNGKLTVSYLSSTNRADDQLRIRHEGGGAGQVGVSGSDVQFGGVSVGTISATLDGAAGRSLEITWKAAATEAIVERVLENLSYASTSAQPLPSRTVRLNLTDNAGNSSGSDDIVINITPQADAAALVALRPQEQVNSYEVGQQTAPVVGRLMGSNDGGYVVVWQSEASQDGDGHGVFAQRYASNGAAVGAEFQVNTTTLNNQAQAAVGGLASGGYVIAWRAQGQDGSGTYGVYAQRYLADGTAAGPEFRVNTTTTADQYEPAVLGLADGSFIVAFRSDYNNAAGSHTYDVLAQRYDASGNPLGAEFALNTTGGATQFQPQLAALDGGGFVALWGDTSGDGNGYGVAAQRFDNAGNKVGGLIAVNTTIASNQYGADIAALPGGGFVATWWSSGGQVYAQRFAADGSKLGGEVLVSTQDTSASNDYARIAVLGDGGFIVTWDSNASSAVGGNGYDVWAQQFNASGAKVDGPRLINTTTASTQYLPDVVGLNGNNAVIVWAGYDQESSTQNTYAVFQQLLGTAGSITTSAAPVLTDVVSAVSFAENLVNVTPQLIDTGVGIVDPDSANFDGGTLWVSVISGYGNIETAQLADPAAQQDQFGIRHQGSAAGQVGLVGLTVTYGGVAIGSIAGNGQNGADLVVTFNAAATAAAVEAVLENLTYRNTSSAPVASRTVSIGLSDGDGGTSVPRLVTINVTPDVDGAAPLFGNERVNTYGLGNQEDPSSAALSDGGYITVWASDGQDGWSSGVYAQRFDAKGVPVGAEFRINDETRDVQSEPAVTGLAGGGYVVTWRSNSQDGSSAGVYAQRFDNNGTRLGDEFRVNTDTDSNQYQPAITALADGGFVVAWYDDGSTTPTNSEYYDVFFQRYNAAGVAQGPQTRANPTGTGQYDAQYEPAVAGLTGGGFVMFWRDDNEDGSLSGVYGQRFDASGAASGAVFRANTTTANYQWNPSTTGLADGGWVVVWNSRDQDGSGDGVFGQRYAADGSLVGGEFRVNTVTTSTQGLPNVTALSHGGFVVSYTSQGLQYVQQFDASGARLDGELRVDTMDNNGNAETSSVVGLANGGFVVSFRDYDYSQGTTYNVYQQFFGNAATDTRQASPQLVDVNASVSFAENTVNSTPQLLDATIGLSDADSANFGGGSLEVNYLTGYALQDQLGLSGLSVQDQLGLRHQGSGAGQVGVSGSTVSYGGTAIGTITSDGANGSKLSISFNANATVLAVERVIENLTYANTFSDPAATRTVSIRVTDGDGGASEARTIQINITPEADGAQALHGNAQVNSYEPGTQTSPATARLSDGSYVTIWESQTTQDGWEYGVYGQRFDANGVPIGTEFQVNSYTPYSQTEPAVAALSGGGYVVVWRSANQDGSGAGVYAQRFSNSGTPLGGEFRVNTSVDSSQYQPTVTGLSNGGFVVGWYDDSYTNPTNTEHGDVLFQRFDASGVAQGVETRANPAGTGTFEYQYEPNFVGLSAGGFLAFWRDDTEDGSLSGVYGQRFDNSGATVGAAFRVNSETANYQWDPAAAALADGGWIVTWTSRAQDSSSDGVYAQRYAADGSTVGGEFRVNTTVSGNQSQPAVASLTHGGFAVTWYDQGKITVQQFAANGARIDGELQADLAPNGSNYGDAPTIAGLDNGAFVVSFRDYDDSTNEYNVYQQLFGTPANFVRQGDPQLVDVASSVTFAENTINALPQRIDAGVGLQDVDSPNFDGGVLEVNYLTGYGAQDQLGLQGLDAQDQLGILSEGTGAQQVSVLGNTVSYQGVAIGTITHNGANGNKLAVQFNANATVAAVEQVIENLTYANTASNPLASRSVSIRVTDGDGGASEARTVTINVTPETDGAVKFGIEKVVNTSRGGNQLEPSVTRLADGGYVVTWQDESGQDGSSYGIYQQRYDANDAAVGGEVRVNTTTSGAQYEAQVAALSNGGWVVVWRGDGQDGSGAGVYSQRYNADGSTAGGEARVNTSVDSNQYQPAVTATATGYIVAWYDDGATVAGNTEFYDVMFQRFDVNGVALGAETRANPVGTGQFVAQYQPTITTLTSGDFVVLYRDDSRDGSGAGIFGQRFDANGVAQGASFQVNAYVNSTQAMPSVAALSGGGFVAVWESEGQDLSSTGIYAQRFDALGNPQGTEYRVNTTISSTQSQPEVTGLANGGYVVTWSDSSSTGWDVKMQQYDASGRAVDGETLVNSYQPHVQSQPAVASMADGGFVIAYAGYIYSSDQTGDGIPDGGNDTYEIRLQRFSNTAPNVSDVLVNGTEEQLITLTDALFEGGFVDPDGQSLQAIKIITPPASGELRFNGTPVTIGQEISIADLEAGLLTYQGNPDFFGADQFRWTGSDGIAFASTPVFTNIVLDNINDGPRLALIPNGNGSEGSTFSATLNIGDPDPEGHRITVNWGDGSADTQFTTSSATPQINHVYADNGAYTVTVTVNDQQGLPNSIEQRSFTATIGNVAPTIGLAGNNTVEQGQVYTLDLGNPADPGADTVSEYRVDWGDGSPVQTFTAATLPANGIVTHTYLTTGSKTILVGLTDEDGAYNPAGSKTIAVSAPAEVITVDAGADATVNEGAFFTRTITFDDPTDQSPNGRSYTVTWGDGQTSTGFLAAGQTSFNIGHAYADQGGPFAVTVTVDDSGLITQQGSDSFLVTVNNVAPTVSINGAGSIAEGSSYTITLAKNDPGTDVATEYVIDWGDGSVAQVVPAASFPANGQFTHTYADGNITRQIRVQVTDEDGTFVDAGVSSVFVANVAPTAPVSGANTVVEGTAYTLNVGTVVDPGQDTIAGYSINWGDGTPNSNFTAAEWAAAGGVFTHVYADGVGAGTPRTISVTASDEDGSFTIGSKTIGIVNANPGLSLAGAAATNEGATYALAITGSDVNADTLSYSIDWGDGSPAQVVTAAQLATLGGSVGHVFADDQDGPVNTTARTITVTASDEDGGSTQATRVVDVNNVAPTLALGGSGAATAGQAYTLNLGARVDPGQDTATSYIINWGDGSPAQTVAAATGSVTHTFASAGNATISVTVVDEDGSFAAGSQAVVIAAPTPTVSFEAGGNAVLSEGATFARTISFSDGQDNGAAGWTYTVDYGDGTVINGSTATPSIELNHLY
ncbi:PKD domain-containing protein, partial [Roseateles sp. LKC17W]